MGNLKTIIFIGANKTGSSRDAIRAAEKLGYFTVLFTNNEKQFRQREAYSDVHKMIFVDITNITTMERAINQLKTNSFDIVIIVSFVDPYVHTASLLCDKFCKNYTNSKAIQMMEDKEETRNYLKDYAFTPKFLVLRPKDPITNGKLGYPVIIKSPKSTGSKDVLLAVNKKQVEKHVLSLQEKYPKDTVMLEEYLDGPQYLVETIIYNKQPHIIGVMEQEITQGKRFIITGYSVLANIPSKMQVNLEEIVSSIVDAFEIENGAMHLELRLTKSGWKLIEINPRISGGAMNKMIQAAFGFSLVEETLKLFLGKKPDVTPKYRNYVHTKYIVVGRKGILEKVTGKNRANNSSGVVDVYIKPRRGTLLVPPLSMGHRYAYVIATGATKHEAKRNATMGAKEIQFHMKVE
ncbi:ATP-grasp domain-containing protein [Solibacillus sp. CAU 1738]|uniref:ATP-grasp domain-containing protein n=1 Tax=Solibacillus sp. CAU 1738 TaxID=3140363 RepID=UPI003261C36A